MLTSLRRIYFYIIAAGALLFIASALQNFIYQLLVQAGVRDYAFNSPTPQAFSQSVAFLLVALAIVAPVGALHWWFIRRDAQEDPEALRGVVREIFLDLLTLGIGTTVIIAGAATGYAAFFSPDEGPGIASPLAVFLAWGLALAALIVERRATPPDQLPAARGISMVLGYLQQLGLLIAVVVAGSLAVQNLLDRTITALPSCDVNFDRLGPCQEVPSTPLGSAIALFVIFALGLAGFTIWTRRDTSSIFRRLADAAFLITGTITAVTGVFTAADLVLHLVARVPGVAWPEAIITSIGFDQHYLFVGPLVMGVGVLAFYLTRAFLAREQRQQARQTALVAVALPLAVIFLSSLISLLAGLFDNLRGHPYDTQTWLDAWSGFISGIAWLGLWPVLAHMSDPHGKGPSVPRRVYEIILLGGTLLGAVISLAVALYFLITSAINATADPSGAAETRAFSAALVLGAVAGYYYFVFQRDQRILRLRAPTATSPAPAPAEAGSDASLVPATLEDVLQQVAARKLAVPQAAQILRERFGAR